MIRDMLSSIDPNTMILGLLFIIFYVFINFSLSKVFKKERASSAIISICVSLLAVYGINKTNFDVSGLFYNIGINENILYTIVPWIILGLAILGSFAKDETTGKRRFRLYKLFMILGAFFILLSFFTYEKGTVMIIGIVLLLIGLFLWFMVRKKKGKIPQQNTGNGRDALIKAAKQFKDWAKKQQNPRFVGTWAKFINWLGGSEAQICQRYGVSQSDFVHIFNKYGLV
jgi:hypothetical protein